MKYSRRTSLKTIGATLSSVALTNYGIATAGSSLEMPLIATNTYPWLTFAQRSHTDFEIHSDGLLERIANTGINGYEPIIEEPSEFSGLTDRLKQHGLQMTSIYVNSTLHRKEQVDESVAKVLKIADAASANGVKIIVTNPSPIQWGGSQNKTDQQIRFQAESLDFLGSELRKRDLTLAYHNHDAELREGAREFHHMLTATDPENVRFCLDAHWVFRGCGDSEVAVFDAMQHYGERIVELHLRQSEAGVWTESFSMHGDIDYTRIIGFLRDKGKLPHLVLEQAVESASPNTLNAESAHKASFLALKGWT